eukprot:jgi/Chrpa1/673/Chrysochromulina_OHIO_Genome00011358-RA
MLTVDSGGDRSPHRRRDGCLALRRRALERRIERRVQLRELVRVGRAKLRNVLLVAGLSLGESLGPLLRLAPHHCDRLLARVHELLIERRPRRLRLGPRRLGLGLRRLERGLRRLELGPQAQRLGPRGLRLLARGLHLGPRFLRLGLRQGHVEGHLREGHVGAQPRLVSTPTFKFGEQRQSRAVAAPHDAHVPVQLGRLGSRRLDLDTRDHRLLLLILRRARLLSWHLLAARRHGARHGARRLGTRLVLGPVHRRHVRPRPGHLLRLARQPSAVSSDHLHALERTERRLERLHLGSELCGRLDRPPLHGMCLPCVGLRLGLRVLRRVCGRLRLRERRERCRDELGGLGHFLLRFPLGLDRRRVRLRRVRLCLFTRNLGLEHRIHRIVPRNLRLLRLELGLDLGALALVQEHRLQLLELRRVLLRLERRLEHGFLARHERRLERHHFRLRRGERRAEHRAERLRALDHLECAHERLGLLFRACQLVGELCGARRGLRLRLRFINLLLRLVNLLLQRAHRLVQRLGSSLGLGKRLERLLERLRLRRGARLPVREGKRGRAGSGRRLVARFVSL